MSALASRVMAIASTSRTRSCLVDAHLRVMSHARRSTLRCGLVRLSASSDEGDASESERGRGDDGAGELSASDLQILQARMEAIRAQEATLEQLPIVVLDASVPKQVLPLTFDASNPKRKLNAGTSLGENVKIGDRFCMLGQAPSNGQILPNGVVVTVNRLLVKPSGESLVELIAGQRFAIVGAPFEDEENQNAPSARVRWIENHLGAGAQTVEGVDAVDDIDPSSSSVEARALALELPSLVDDWLALVVAKKRERQPDQMQLILSHLGERPNVDQPAELACWIAGLINPIPALGVAYEIRPALLCAPTVGDMISIVYQGIKLSIEKLRGAPEM